MKSLVNQRGFFYSDKKLVYICTMMSTQFLFISGGEIFFIMFIVVMVFGADKIPGIAKGLGKGMRQLRDATDDIKREIQKSADKQGIDTSVITDIQKDIDDVKSSIDTGITKDVKKGFGDIGKTIGDAAGSIKRK